MLYIGNIGPDNHDERAASFEALPRVFEMNTEYNTAAIVFVGVGRNGMNELRVGYWDYDSCNWVNGLTIYPMPALYAAVDKAWKLLGC